jgi:hypothetical protein
MARLMAAVRCYIWTVARKSNVNPDHYRTAGREPQGQAVVHEVERQKLRERKARSSQTKKPVALRKAGGGG